MEPEKFPAGLELIVLDDKAKPCANPATRAIPVFKEIFARTRRTGKGQKEAYKRALDEFLYIYYMIDIRSFAIQKHPVGDNNIERHNLVVKTLKFEEDWRPDAVVTEAAEWYKAYQYNSSPVMRMLKTGLRAISHTIDYFEEVDYTKKDSKGRPIYTPKDVLETLNSLESQKENIKKLELQVIGEINRGGTPKGGGQINTFEDRPSLETIESYSHMPNESEL